MLNEGEETMMTRKSSQEIGSMIESLKEETEGQEEDDEVEGVSLAQELESTDTQTMTAIQPVSHIYPRQYLIRRSSSAVDRTPFPAPLEEKQGGGDMSLRPRFLQERSATIVHITHQTTDPSREPRSKASAFLMDVMAKSKVAGGSESRRSSLEPLRTGVTNTLHYAPQQGAERGVPLRMVGNSRRFRRQISTGSSKDLLGSTASEVARKRRVSASQEHMSAVVQALQANKQQMEQQLDILHSILRCINVNERDDDGKIPILKEMVDAGIIPELAGIMREFRFNTDLQVCVMSILSALAEESHVNAYMMSELHIERLLQKSAAVHASEDRIVLLASNLVHAIEDSKSTVNITAYKAEKAAKVRRQSASYTDMVVAAITAKTKSAPSPHVKSAPSRRINHHSLQTTEAQSRASIGSAGSERNALDGLSVMRKHQAFALDMAPPALSANYRLLFSQKLKRDEIPPLTTVEGENKKQSPTEKRVRPASSPVRRSLQLDLTSRSLTAAIYSGRSIFVEPSPLSKRLPYRGSFSAGGVRRKLSVPRNGRRPQTERLPPTLVSLDPIQPPAIPQVPTKSARTPESEENPNEEKSKRTSEDEGGEEESYEDDFDTTGEETEQKMHDRQERIRFGSDGDLLDLLLGSTEPTTVEMNAATTIQRHIRGVLVRRIYPKPRTKVSAHTTPRLKTPRIMKSVENRKRWPKREGSRKKRELPAPRVYQREKERELRSGKPMTSTLRAVGKQCDTKPTNQTKGFFGSQHRRNESNNQLHSPSKTTKVVVEPKHKNDDFEMVKAAPDPESLKVIQTLYAEGLQHHKENHLGLAIECYEKALGLPGGQEFASIYVNLGSALMTQNKVSEALESFQQAQRIQPNNVKAIYNNALALLHLDRLHEAQRLLRRTLELDPTHEKAATALSHLTGKDKPPGYH
ncbi:hypothetical protein P3T76_014732 [Phytophthora citrophthora]|uniref:Tetratricopeptide repeat protein n=1 Tax=Phytophthora citrophthora TaxID=4793 RepID=A0AAD9G1E1_9STRA|nr:hypothetical protein P3T76_014732 [Phytophthora citrophthora]